MENFNMLIGTQPGNGLKNLISKDINYLKVGLLYGDKVKLSSLGAVMLKEFLDIKDIKTTRDKAEMLKSFAIGTGNQDAISSMNYYFTLLSRKRLSKEEVMHKYNFVHMINSLFSNLSIKLKQIAKETKFEGIEKAKKLGKIEFDIFVFDSNDEKNYIDVATEYFVGNLMEEMLNGDSYPLLDEEMNSIVGNGLDLIGATVSTSSSDRVKHSGFTSDIITKLPYFNNATIDEILDIRKDLEKYLCKFRVAMMKYSSQIKSEKWDYDFEYDVQKIFMMEILPIVQEIEEESKTNRYLYELMDKVISSKLYIPSALGLTVKPVADFLDITERMVAYGIVSANVAHGAYKSWNQKEKKIKQNHLYFYYKSGQKLK